MVAIAIKHFLSKISTLFQSAYPIISTINQCKEVHKTNIIKFIIESFAKLNSAFLRKNQNLFYI